MSAYMISVAMEPTGALNIRTVSACPASACMTASSASTAMVAAASAPRAPAETPCGKNREDSGIRCLASTNCQTDTSVIISSLDRVSAGAS